MPKPKFINALTPSSTVYNLLILDESDSMDLVRQITVGGFNELVQTVQGLTREFPEKKQVVTLTTFNGLGVNEKLFMLEANALQQLTHDNLLKQSRLTDQERLEFFRNTYKVLMTRGMKGCCMYFEDEETGQFFRSRMNT